MPDAVLSIDGLTKRDGSLTAVDGLTLALVHDPERDGQVISEHRLVGYGDENVPEGLTGWPWDQYRRGANRAPWHARR